MKMIAASRYKSMPFMNPSRWNSFGWVRFWFHQIMCVCLRRNRTHLSSEAFICGAHISASVFVCLVPAYTQWHDMPPVHNGNGVVCASKWPPDLHGCKIWNRRALGNGYTLATRRCRNRIFAWYLLPPSQHTNIAHSLFCHTFKTSSAKVLCSPVFPYSPFAKCVL